MMKAAHSVAWHDLKGSLRDGLTFKVSCLQCIVLSSIAEAVYLVLAQRLEYFFFLNSSVHDI